MTTEEEHKTIQDELEEDLNEKIHRGIVGKRQKLIGFSTSEASANLFARLLHKLNLITPGFNVNHRFFLHQLKGQKKSLASNSRIRMRFLGFW